MMMDKNKCYIFFAFAAILIAVGFGYLVHAQRIGVTLPSVPAGVVAATSAAPLQVSVSWAASAESSGTIMGYYIYRNGVEIGTTAGTSFVDSSLQPGFYTYAVAAYDAYGAVSAQSTPASLTLIKDTAPPTTPTGVTITGTTSTNSIYAPVTLTVSWSPSSDNIGVAGYYVYRNGISITTSTSGAFTGTSIADTVPPGTYNYAIVAYDTAQNFSGQSTSTIVTVALDTIPPPAPTNISVQQVSANSVNLTWSSSTDSAGVAGYQIFRNGIQVATTTGSPYADSGLSARATYFYQVGAYDVAGNRSGASSPPVSVTVQPTNGPGVPYALSAAFLGTSSVAISWAPSIDSLSITGYTIYRKGAQIATVTSTHYLDTGLASGTYTYNLTATDVSGAVSPMSASSSLVIVPAFVPASIPAAAVAQTPSAVVAPPPATTTAAAGPVDPFTQSLYLGLRSAQVVLLQALLVQKGYLVPANETGFFGELTLAGLEKFQCDENIVCTNGTGWGLVGPKTRSVLNTLSGSSASASAASSSSSSLAEELQILEAELASLKQQARGQ